MVFRRLIVSSMAETRVWRKLHPYLNVGFSQTLIDCIKANRENEDLDPWLELIRK